MADADDRKFIKMNSVAIELMNTLNMNVYQGATVINVLDYFPLLKLGYTTFGTYRSLLSIYRQTIDIDIIEKAFGGIIPDDVASLYEHDTQDMLDKSNDKYFMGMIKKEDYMFSEVLEWYVIISGIKTSNNVNNTSLDFFYRTVSQHYKSLWKSTLLSDDRIKLYFAIIINKEFWVEIFLNEIDPRFDNNEAYHLAKDKGNNNIINAVKTKIIQLNLLYDEVLKTQLLGYEQLAEDIKLSKYL
jgi:hypothetical protein